MTGTKIGLVVLDTLRYDVFDSEFDQLQAQADHRFEQLYSTSRWTVPAHASLFTGYYPTEVGTHSENQHLTTEQPTLAERLSDAGFETVGCSNNTYVDRFFKFDRGFETFHRGPDLQGKPTESSGFDWADVVSDLSGGARKYPEALAAVVRSDAPTVQTLRNGVNLLRSSGSMGETTTIDWLFDSLEGHFDSQEDLFVFANLMTCHSPYVPPEEYRTVEPYTVDPLELTLRDEPVTDEEHERHWTSYRDCARYLDDELTRLVDATEWDALFIISDHGELFGEHGLRQHQYGVYEDLVHVPGVAFGDAVPAGQSESPQSILDIHRTLLNIASVEFGQNTRGQDLFDGESREHIYAESVGNYRYSPDAKGIDAKIPESWGDPHYIYATSDYQYINDKDGPRVYDMETGEIRPDKRECMQSSCDEFRQALTDMTGASVSKEVPREIQSRLEHLGYR